MLEKSLLDIHRLEHQTSDVMGQIQILPLLNQFTILPDSLTRDASLPANSAFDDRAAVHFGHKREIASHNALR